MRFNFLGLWNYVNDTYYRDPNSPDLIYKSGYPSLTKDACIRLAASGMSRYDDSTIWIRATTWKIPLIQVFVMFPRPPLNIKSKFFVMAHLLGNPIDTVQNLLLKISRSQKRVNDWKTVLRTYQIPIEPREDHVAGHLWQSREVEQIKECRWKSLALVTDAYDEWGKAGKQVEVMRYLFEESSDKPALLRCIQDTSNALTADRTTQYLPSIVALTFFIGNIGIAMKRTAAAIGTPAFNTSIFINLEVHSVIFSSLYFWIIPTLLFGAFIGVSQTEITIPRILERLHNDLDRHFSEPTPHPNLERIKIELRELRNFVAPKSDYRMFFGGIYSWQPSRALYDTQDNSSIPLQELTGNTSSISGNVQPSSSESNPRDQSADQTPEIQPNTANTQAFGTEGDDDPDHAMQTSNLLPPFTKQKPTFLSNLPISLRHRFLPLFIVLIPTVFGSIASSRVPPDGWNCRVTGEVFIFFSWFLSAELDHLITYFIPPRFSNLTKLFWYTFVKDTFFALGTTIWVIVTVVGALNRCDCWIDHDGVTLILPQRHDIDILLRHRLNVDYPACIFSSVAIELVFIPLWVKYWYSDALKVYVQRDDGKSNFDWVWNAMDGMRRKTKLFVWWLGRKLRG